MGDTNILYISVGLGFNKFMPKRILICCNFPNNDTTSTKICKILRHIMVYATERLSTSKVYLKQIYSKFIKIIIR